MNERRRLLSTMAERDAQGRYGVSLKLIAHALAAARDDRELLAAKASTLFHSRRCWEARAVGLKAEALGLKSLDLDLLLGWCCFGVGKLDEAEAWMRRAVDTAPDASQSHFNLAVVLQGQERHEAAAASFERGLALAGSDFDTHIGLGRTRLALGDLGIRHRPLGQGIGDAAALYVERRRIGM